MTAAEIMRLVEDYAGSINFGSHDEWMEVREETVTAIEQLVTENVSLKTTLEREVDLCKRVMGERDEAVSEANDCRHKLQWADKSLDEGVRAGQLLRVQYEHVKADRDSALALVERLKAALRKTCMEVWTREGKRVISCRNCEAWSAIGESVIHRADCIVHDCQ